MLFNLIDEKWIPVMRRDGAKLMIAPWQVTDQFMDNPIVSLDAPRPDFNGALIQFLIGLVQTVAAPQNAAEWRKLLSDPPKPDELKEQFEKVRHAFELGGDGHRFMQDCNKLTVTQNAIDGLLIDMPGENAKKKNTDHFVKRNTVKRLCPACVATALFTMQTNAPAGGQGNRTSLRGGGPLSTLIVGDKQHATVWQLVWLNVLEDIKFKNICGNSALSDDAAKFPWLAATRTSENDEVCLPNDFHPTMMFWGTPRRIRLNMNNLESGNCDICNVPSKSLIIQYQQKNFGMNFGGAWLHPLSPYSMRDTKEPVPIHPQPSGITYRHWLGLVQLDNDGSKIPARIVHEFINERHRNGWQFRIWAFGYDMKNMNARCWYESMMPLLYIDCAIRQEYESIVAGMIRAAIIVAQNLRIAIKNAMNGQVVVDQTTRKIKWIYRDIKKMPMDEDKRRAKVLYETREDTILNSVELLLWQNTEVFFYQLMSNITKALENNEAYLPNLKDWHNCLCKEATALFNSYLGDVPVEDVDPKRVVISKKEMEIFNHGDKVKRLLNL